MGGPKSGVLGTDPSPKGPPANDDPVAAARGRDLGAPTGFDHLSVSRTITAAVKDWEPDPKIRKTPKIIVSGKTLEAVAKQLSKRREWGEAGGRLRVDSVPVGASEEVTITVRGNFFYLIPEWADYERASKAARDEWDRMLKYLEVHEKRHLEIAIEEANTLAKDLISEDIDKIAAFVTDANKELRRRQNQLDAQTKNGSKKDVDYGNVDLNQYIK